MSTRFRDTSSARSSSSANALVSHKASALLMNTPGSMDVAPMEQNVPTRSAVSPISAARKKFFPLTKTISPPRVEATSGSVLLIWPEGIVYGGVTAERIERIVHEHVIGGHPIEPWIVQRLPFQGLSQPLEPQPPAP